MSLIDIVQLVLLGFAIFFIIIFLVSYLGYKTKKGNTVKSERNQESENQIESEVTLHENITQTSNDKIYQESDNNFQKYEVFNPGLNKKTNPKKHFPRTLFIKK